MSDTAAVSSTQEPLPVYIQDQVPQSALDALLTRITAPISTSYPDARVVLESFIESQKAPAYDGPEKTEPPKPIDHYPLNPSSNDTLTRVQQEIVNELFVAITREDSQAVVLLIQHNLVTANTRSEADRTPLLGAVSTKNITIVKTLLELGADPNAFGVVRYGFHDQATRTPLMLAASIGSLPIVKLLFETHSADDTLVAPDGQIALRLAAAAGHRTIVEYLPSRRAGGFIRFKTLAARHIARIKEALIKIGKFIKIFIWDVPKCFWNIFKELVVRLVNDCKWCWANRKRFGRWCKHQVTEMPKRVARLGKAVWKGVKKVPKAVKKMGKELWKFGTETLPRWVKEFAIWLWKLVTVRIPKAIHIALKWVWEGISSLGHAIWDITLRIVSFLHTILEAIITFLRNVTLKDIWNGFCDVLQAVFVTFPTALWSWIEAFGKASYRFMKTLFGLFGELLWWIVCGLKDLAVYIPRKLWIILQSLASSLAGACYEIIVWINPKA